MADRDGAATVSHNVGQEYDKTNFLLMHAMGPNVAGVIGSAIAAGCVDIVALAPAMPGEILRVAAGQGFSPPQAGSAVDERASLEAVVALLREHHRHDLSDYKASTLRRRIQRRMAVHGIATTAAPR